MSPKIVKNIVSRSKKNSSQVCHQSCQITLSTFSFKKSFKSHSIPSIPLNNFPFFFETHIWLLIYKQSSHPSQFHIPKVLLSCQRTFLSSIQLVFTSYSFLLPLFLSLRKSPSGILSLRLSLSFILFYILKKCKKYYVRKRFSW